MRKLTCSLIMALAAISAIAQIPGRILDLEPGKSTLANVKAMALAHKWGTEVRDDMVYLLSSEGIEYEGLHWTMACVQMYQGKVMAIMFTETGDESALLERYNTVSKNLLQKYAPYLRTDAEVDMRMRKVKPFSDGNTWVDVTMMGGERPYVALTYMDCALAINSQEDAK